MSVLLFVLSKHLSGLCMIPWGDNAQGKYVGLGAIRLVAEGKVFCGGLHC